MKARSLLLSALCAACGAAELLPAPAPPARAYAQDLIAAPATLGSLPESGELELLRAHAQRCATLVEEAERQVDLAIAEARQTRDIIMLGCLWQKQEVIRSVHASVDEAFGRVPSWSFETGPEELRSMHDGCARALTLQAEARQCIGEGALQYGPTRVRNRVRR